MAKNAKQMTYPTASSPVPPVIQDLLLSGGVLAVVGLNEGDISFGHHEIQRYLETDMHISPALIAQISRTHHLFSYTSVQENIFVQTAFPFHKRSKAIRAACDDLFLHFQIHIDPLASIAELDSDEKYIIELLRAYVRHPKYLFLYDTMSFLGYSYTNTFRRILDQFLFQGCTVIYMSNKWENVLQIADHYSIVYRERFLPYTCSAEEVQANPRRLVYLLSGIDSGQGNEGEPDVSTNVLNSIFNSSELFIKNNELAQSLNHLIQAIKSTLNAYDCILYIKNEYDIIHSYAGDTEDAPHFKLRDSFVSDYIENDRDVVYLNFDSECETRTHYFENPENAIRYMICLPVRNSAHGFGLLQMAYQDSIAYTEQQMLVINTYCNEISILVETSRLFNQSILLRESNHRIKNNLQIIIGMLYTQQQKLRQPNSETTASDVIDNTISRIKSIALVHNLLTTNTNGGSIISIDVLIDELIRLYESKESPYITIQKSVEPFYIMYNQATYIAIMINELISNCIKHAFTDLAQAEKIIRVNCKSIDYDIILTLSDNGRGFPNDFNINTTSSMGMTIIQSMVKSMNGEMTIKNDHGSSVRIVLPNARFSSKNFL